MIKDNVLRGVCGPVPTSIMNVSHKYLAFKTWDDKPHSNKIRLDSDLDLRQITRRTRLRNDKSPSVCAGINRHEGEDERALRERSSEPLGPEFCTALREG
jgi:hypothetical protein